MWDALKKKLWNDSWDSLILLIHAAAAPEISVWGFFGSKFLGFGQIGIPVQSPPHSSLLLRLNFLLRLVCVFANSLFSKNSFWTSIISHLKCQLMFVSKSTTIEKGKRKILKFSCEKRSIFKIVNEFLRNWTSWNFMFIISKRITRIKI